MPNLAKYIQFTNVSPEMTRDQLCRAFRDGAEIST